MSKSSPSRSLLSIPWRPSRLVVKPDSCLLHAPRKHQAGLCLLRRGFQFRKALADPALPHGALHRVVFREDALQELRLGGRVHALELEVAGRGAGIYVPVRAEEIDPWP